MPASTEPGSPWIVVDRACMAAMRPGCLPALTGAIGQWRPGPTSIVAAGMRPARGRETSSAAWTNAVRSVPFLPCNRGHVPDPNVPAVDHGGVITRPADAQHGVL